MLRKLRKTVQELRMFTAAESTILGKVVALVAYADYVRRRAEDPELQALVHSVARGQGEKVERALFSNCGSCELPFQAGFKADDGIQATTTTCAGCIRTQIKKREGTRT